MAHKHPKIPLLNEQGEVAALLGISYQNGTMKNTGTSL
jgi:hypothetical protein